MLIPVILSGGAGTRLWPVSREAHPKPFMRLPDGQSLLQKTLGRALCLDDVGSILTVTNRDYYFQTRDEFAGLAPGEEARFEYLLEPRGRNTAPAIAMAALYLRERLDDAQMLVLPADHVIADVEAFARAVTEAQRLAAGGYLVTFGIQPTRPETGYGYIERGAAIPGGGADGYAVARFVEKPDLQTAQQYLDSGRFLWNGGMFCFAPEMLLRALEAHAPAVFEQAQACWQATATDIEPLELDRETFGAMEPISIDYAVMEKADNVAVVAGTFDWSDLGSWASVSDLVEVDESGNRISGEAVVLDSSNCFVHSEDRLVAALGLDDLVIVDTPDALLVADRERAQDVKKVVERLKADGHEAYRFHRTVHRPWGTYTVLEEGERFKIKRIVVKPGAALSLQMHHHRSEHWIVVSGTAEVVNGDDSYLVRTNESTYVPAGNAHRLVNPGILDLVMIEVQSGEYLGEDDIVRFEDRYGRES
jgi:mannose-1-phosphate guanylyltransferase/mannose-6-phosphate isomerase